MKGHSDAYAINFNFVWSSIDIIAGESIEYYNIAFKDFNGRVTDKETRPPSE